MILTQKITASPLFATTWAFVADARSVGGEAVIFACDVLDMLFFGLIKLAGTARDLPRAVLILL